MTDRGEPGHAGRRRADERRHAAPCPDGARRRTSTSCSPRSTPTPAPTCRSSSARPGRRSPVAVRSFSAALRRLDPTTRDFEQIDTPRRRQGDVELRRATTSRVLTTAISDARRRSSPASCGASNAVFGTFAQEDASVSSSHRPAPGALARSHGSLGQAGATARLAGRRARRTAPDGPLLAPAERASQSCSRSTAARPQAPDRPVHASPPSRRWRARAGGRRPRRECHAATSTSALGVLNTLPQRARLQRRRPSQPGFLFYLDWLSHDLDSVAEHLRRRRGARSAARSSSRRRARSSSAPRRRRIPRSAWPSASQPAQPRGALRGVDGASGATAADPMQKLAPSYARIAPYRRLRPVCLACASSCGVLRRDRAAAGQGLPLRHRLPAGRAARRAGRRADQRRQRRHGRRPHPDRAGRDDRHAPDPGALRARAARMRGSAAGQDAARRDVRRPVAGHPGRPAVADGGTLGAAAGGAQSVQLDEIYRTFDARDPGCVPDLAPGSRRLGSPADGAASTRRSASSTRS